MTQTIASLLAEAEQIQLPALLWFIFTAGLIEVVFPPFPGDSVFLAGGFIAGHRGFPIAWPVLASCLGTFLAAAGLFAAGRVGGRPLLRRRFFARLLPPPQLARVEGWFSRFGLWVLAGSRFIPVVRSGIALAAGLADLSPLRGLTSLAAGIAVFNTLLVLGGSLAGANWRALAAFVSALGWTAVIAVVGLVAARVFMARRRRR